MVELLRHRGLRIENPQRVSHYLRNIGYYRLSAYMFPFLRQPKDMIRFLCDLAIKNTILATGERQCSIFSSDFQRFRRYWTDMLRFQSRFSAVLRFKSGWIKPLRMGGHAPFSPNVHKQTNRNYTNYFPYLQTFPRLFTFLSSLLSNSTLLWVIGQVHWSGRVNVPITRF